ncbi:DNA cytosine methyltransferase [Neomoorella thermoacetica]|uniref:DNA cytosine methyltransferase n=1 Tax=Neomoorella thermoacetica TaxID=1525 RepID=UPI0030D58783
MTYREGRTLTVLSMFSGCGGMDLGFVQAGYEIVWANDIDEDACATYRRNIGEIHEGDVRNLEVPNIDDLDVLIAGFPCQPFSNAGNRRGLEDPRGQLYRICLEYVERLHPKAVLLENVRGILSIRSEKGTLIEEICSRLVDIGYEVHFKLVDATEYGVPQHRLRVIIVGVKRGIAPSGFRFPRPIEGMDLRLRTCLDVPPGTPNQNDVIRLNPQAMYLGSLIPEGGSWKDVPYDLLPDRLKRIRNNMRRYRWPNFYRRYHRDEIAGTVTAAFKPENAGVWHPTENRPLSAREIARIQTFPDDFVFVGRSVKAIYSMIGNAVPPRLARTFAEMLGNVLRGVPVDLGRPLVAYSQLGKRPIRPSDPEIVFDRPRRESTEESGRPVPHQLDLFEVTEAC